MKAKKRVCEKIRNEEDLCRKIRNSWYKASTQSTNLARALLIFLILMITIQAVKAASVGHSAPAISAGIFEEGNFTFNNTLEILEALNVSNGLLYVDPITSRVGIGTISPEAMLEVTNSSEQDLLLNITNGAMPFVYNSTTGRVGIGTTAPTQALDVHGATRVDSNFYHDNDGVIFYAGGAAANNEWYLQSHDGTNWIEAIMTRNGDVSLVRGGGSVAIGDDIDPEATLEIINGSSDAGPFMISSIAANDGDWMMVDPSGKVGIGTTSPAAMLEIKSTGPTPLYLNISDANVNTVTDMLTLEHVNASGEAADGIGSGILFRSIDNAMDVENISMIAGVMTDTSNASERGALLFYTGYGDENGIISNLSSSETMRLDTEGLRITGNLTVTGAAHLGSITFDTNATFDDSVNISEDLEAGGVLFVDGRYGNVGIGTMSPGAKLEVINDSAYEGLLLNVTNGATDFVYNATTGNVGIGTTAPLSKLHIADTAFGGLRITDVETATTNKYGAITASQFDSATETEGALVLGTWMTSGVNRLSIGGGYAARNAFSQIEFWTAAGASTRTGTQRMTIDSAGNVGIGTTSPTRMLHLATSAGNNETVTDLLSLDVNSTSVTGAGIGPAMIFRATDNVGEFENISMISGILENTANGTERGALLFYTGYGNEDGIINNLSSSETMRLDTEGLRITGNLTVSGAAHLGSITFDTNATFDDSVNISQDLEAGGVLFVDGRYGNVGIGTDSPGAKLSFGTLASSPAIFLYEGGATSNSGLGIQSDEVQYFTSSTSHFSFNAGGDLQPSGTNELVRITGDGKVGIGTTSPAYKLQVEGTTNTTDLRAEGLAHLIGNVTMDDNLTIGGNKFFVDSSSGNVGIGTTTPTGLLNINGTGNTLLNITNESADLFMINETTAAFGDGIKVGIGTTAPDKGLTINDGGSIVQIGNVISNAGWAGIAFETTSPSATNYALLGDSDDTFINAPEGVGGDGDATIYFRIANEATNSKMALSNSSLKLTSQDTYYGDMMIFQTYESPTIYFLNLSVITTSGNIRWGFSQQHGTGVFYPDVLVFDQGKIGIGTMDTGTAKLNVTGTVDAWDLTINGTSVSTSTGGFQWGWTNTTGLVYTTQSSDLVHIGGNVSLADNLTVTGAGGDALYVDSSAGRVGIGTTTPQGVLEVTNTTALTTAWMNVSSGALEKFVIEADGDVIITLG